MKTEPFKWELGDLFMGAEFNNVCFGSYTFQNQERQMLNDNDDNHIKV